MTKTYKTFVKEYAMGLQVPSTSYLKGVGSLKNLTKKEDAKEIYYNLDRGIYTMGKDFRKFDREKEKRQGFPNATKLLSTTKAAADYVAKMNETSSVNTAGEGGVPARAKSSALSNGTPLKRNEVSDKLKGKVLDRKIARAKTKFKSKAFLSKP